MRKTVIVDLDGTLTVDEHGVPYPEKRLNTDIANATHAAKARGYDVLVLTARGMRTYNNDRSLVEQHVKPVVETWIQHNGVPADDIQVAKPWCGPRGFYVDDRNLHLEEFLFRFSGPFADQPVAAFVRGNLDGVGGFFAVHRRLCRIERWLDICSWNYPAGTAPDPKLKDVLLAPEGDGRRPTWALIIHLGASLTDPSGYFAYHHDHMAAEPIIEHRLGGGFALVPMAILEQHGVGLADIQAGVQS